MRTAVLETTINTKLSATFSHSRMQLSHSSQSRHCKATTIDNFFPGQITARVNEMDSGLQTPKVFSTNSSIFNWYKFSMSIKT